MREDRRVTCPNCGSLAFVRILAEGWDPLGDNVYTKIYRCEGCETEWYNTWEVTLIDAAILK